MKGAVLGLLLANVMLAAWVFLQPGRGDIQLTTAPDVISRAAGMAASIELLAEVPEQSLVRYAPMSDPAPVLLNEAPSPGASEATQPVQSQSCVELGPLATRQLADSVIAAAQDIALEVQVRTQPLPPVYRVYLPQLDSREAALERLEELRAALARRQTAIETFLIPRGELVNGIALGLFSEQRNALNVKEQVEALGFQVTVREEARQEEQFWIVSQPFDFEEKIKPLRDALAQIEPSAQVLEKLCQTIAQDIHLP